MKHTFGVLLSLLIAMGTLGAQGTQEAASFPNPEKSITIIVPQGAGGGTDTQTRKLAAAMESVSGQKILVENVKGGSTGIGTNQVIDSPADGYTLLMYGTYVVCGTMTGNTIGPDGLDFITGLTMEPFMIAVRSDAPYQNLGDLIQAAKANPGKISLGNAGATATTGVVAYGMNIACGNIFNVIDCNGGAELIPYVLGGHINVGIFSQSEVQQNAGQLRPLCFLGDGHSVIPEFASVPNLKDAGYGNLNIPGGCFRGICAPKGTPDQAKQWLADTIEKAFNTKEFQAYLKSSGLLAEFTKLDDFKKYNDNLMKTMQPIIKATGKAQGKYAE